MRDRTSKEYQDEQVQKALKKRDSIMKKNRRAHKEFLQDAYNKAYDVVDKMTKKK
jgi:hypothetical protein